MKTADRHLTDDELETLVASYCAGDLNTDDSMELEGRLATNPVLDARASSIIDTWIEAHRDVVVRDGSRPTREATERARHRFTAVTTPTHVRRNRVFTQWRWRPKVSHALVATLVIASSVPIPGVRAWFASGAFFAHTERMGGSVFMYRHYAKAPEGSTAARVVLLGASRVAVSPGGTLFYRSAGVFSTGYAVALRGTASMRIDTSIPSIDVTTDARTFKITPGEYDVRTFRADSTVIEIRSGRLHVTLRQSRPHAISFGPGEHVVVSPRAIQSEFIDYLEFKKTGAPRGAADTIGRHSRDRPGRRL